MIQFKNFFFLENSFIKDILYPTLLPLIQALQNENFSVIFVNEEDTTGWLPGCVVHLEQLEEPDIVTGTGDVEQCLVNLKLCYDHKTNILDILVDVTLNVTPEGYIRPSIRGITGDIIEIDFDKPVDDIIKIINYESRRIKSKF